MIEKYKKELGYKFDKEAALSIEITTSEKAQEASQNYDKNQQQKGKLQKPLITKDQLEQIKKHQIELKKKDGEQEAPKDTKAPKQ